MKRYKEKMMIKVGEAPPIRRGHYEFHNGKAVFDNRPKRIRTRDAQRREWSKEQEN